MPSVLAGLKTRSPGLKSGATPTGWYRSICSLLSELAELRPARAEAQSTLPPLSEMSDQTGCYLAYGLALLRPSCHSFPRFPVPRYRMPAHEPRVTAFSQQDASGAGDSATSSRILTTCCSSRRCLSPHSYPKGGACCHMEKYVATFGPFPSLHEWRFILGPDRFASMPGLSATQRVIPGLAS
jgi:hypothetical protein